jgi:hypothetical protein
MFNVDVSRSLAADRLSIGTSGRQQLLGGRPTACNEK